MRLRPFAAVAAIAFAAVALTACTPQNVASDGCQPSHADGNAMGMLAVSGEFGSMPTVDFDGPLPAQNSEVRFLEAGDGDRAERGDIVFSHFTIFDGSTGDPVFSSFDAQQPLRVSAGDAETSVLEGAVLCAAEGSRIVAVSTMEDALGEGQALRGSDIRPTDSIVMVYDVTRVVPGRATGIPQPGNAALPSVTTAVDGQPGLSFTGAEPPETLEVSTTIQGAGEELLPGDQVILQYTGVIWQSGEVFDSTWASARPSAMPGVTGSSPAIFTLQQGALIDGFYNGLMGQNVGSQVLISIPQDQGYSDPNTRPPSIGEGDTLVFVVDILGKL